MANYKNWKIKDPKYQSRRGDYHLLEVEGNVLTWTPVPVGNRRRDRMVKDEIQYALENRLHEHLYWADESNDFIRSYTLLYQTMFGLKWLQEPTSRNNVAFNLVCCLSIVQYNNGTLHAYSRSTDMRNGLYSDKIVLDYLAEKINELRPDCTVNKISWYIACPHIYVNEGIARRNKEDQ